MCSRYRESTPDTWKAEGEPLTQHVTTSDQPWGDCVATSAQVLLMLTQPPHHSHTSLLQTQPLTQDNRTPVWKAHPQPLWKGLEKQAPAFPCESSDRTATLPGWNQEMSRAVSHPFDLCLSKNNLKFFLQEQDIKDYSFLQVGVTIYEIINIFQSICI